MPSTYDIRLIQAGNVIEKIEYENPVIVSDVLLSKCVLACKKSGSGRKHCASEIDKIINSEIVLYRARNELRRLINANVYRYMNDVCNTFKPVFLTLTFANNIKDLTWANKEFRKFIKRLGYKIACDQTYLKYVAVPEFQKRGAVHYHLIIFNFPFIKTKVISQIWTHGFVKINSIEGVNNIGAYVCKYMTKAEETKDRLAGHKCYFRSRHLYEPKEMTILSTSELGQEILKIIETMSLQSTYTNEHASEHYGIIKYTQYECGNMDLEGMVQDGKECASIS